MLKKHSNIADKNNFSDFEAGSRNWLLHVRFVRGEHAVCMELADELQQEHDNAHRFAHYVKGLVLVEAGRLQNALEKFHSCIRLQPQDPEPVKQVARCLYRQGRFRLSMEAYQEADKLARHPDPDIYASLALSRLKGALNAHPTCVAAHADLGLALLAKKKYVAALTCLQRSAWTAPLSARASHDLGLALMVCRRPASAFCRLATAAALQPSQAHTVLLIAIVLERLQDPRADVAFARATVMAPTDPLVRLNLAARHARAGRLLEAAGEAAATETLLKAQHRPDQQLARSLAELLSLLKEADSKSVEMATKFVKASSDPIQGEESLRGHHKMAADEV